MSLRFLKRSSSGTPPYFWLARIVPLVSNLPCCPCLRRRAARVRNWLMRRPSSTRNSPFSRSLSASNGLFIRSLFWKSSGRSARSWAICRPMRWAIFCAIASRLASITPSNLAMACSLMPISRNLAISSWIFCSSLSNPIWRIISRVIQRASWGDCAQRIPACSAIRSSSSLVGL